MTPERIEDLAWRNAGMPSGLNIAEQMLFQGFRRLYAYAKMTGMSAEQGRWEKGELLREFRMRQFQLKRMEKTDRMWAEIEAAANRFGKERTIENAEAFVKAVYGAGMKQPPETGKEETE